MVVVERKVVAVAIVVLVIENFKSGFFKITSS